MHPDDIAEFVAEGAAELQARAAELPPDLRPGAVELRERWHVDVHLELRRLASESVQIRRPLIVPGASEHTRVAIPILGTAVRRDLILHADCSNFDSQPPLIDLLDPELQSLAPAQWPRDPQGRGIIQNHPRYRRPFFCRIGTREFHEHPQHEDQAWDRYREQMTLPGIILPLVIDLHRRFVL